MHIKIIRNATILCFYLATTQALADQVTVNNNNSSPGYNQPAVAVPTCPPANQNNIYDPRIPPAGVYRSQSSTTYTTGEKKPYITDNNCNNSTAPAQPYVFVQPPK